MSVTYISYYAFSGCASLTSIVVPDDVTFIGSNAFSSCTSLTDVYSYATTPISISSLVFSYTTYKNATLHVPTGCVETYQSTDYWSNFYNIKEFDATPVEGVQTDGTLEETGRYSLDGKRIGSQQKGVNIVRYSDGSTKKVLVK